MLFCSSIGEVGFHLGAWPNVEKIAFLKREILFYFVAP
jgi:hypothetical protein